jgi:hypothetical protein
MRNQLETFVCDLNLCVFSIRIVKETRQRNVERTDGQGMVVAIMKTQVMFNRIPIGPPT